jgi:hypothetical protein
VEREEFLKGPSSVLYGATGALGGVPNTVTKKPTPYRVAELEASGNENGLARGTIDLAGPVGRDSTLRFRFIAAGERSRNFRPFNGGADGVSVVPSIEYHTARTIVRLTGEYTRRRVVDGGGAVHVAWYTGAPGRVGLWYARSLDGGRSFAAPVPLLGKGHVAPSHVRLAVAGRSVYGAWEDRRGAHPRVVFGPPIMNGAAIAGDGDFPWIAVGGDRLAVTWLDRGAVRLRVARLSMSR